MNCENRVVAKHFFVVQMDAVGGFLLKGARNLY